VVPKFCFCITLADAIKMIRLHAFEGLSFSGYRPIDFNGSNSGGLAQANFLA